MNHKKKMAEHKPIWAIRRQQLNQNLEQLFYHGLQAIMEMHSKDYSLSDKHLNSFRKLCEGLNRFREDMSKMPRW